MNVEPAWRRPSWPGVTAVFLPAERRARVDRAFGRPSGRQRYTRNHSRGVLGASRESQRPLGRRRLRARTVCRGRPEASEWSQSIQSGIQDDRRLWLEAPSAAWIPRKPLSHRGFGSRTPFRSLFMRSACVLHTRRAQANLLRVPGDRAAC